MVSDTIAKINRSSEDQKNYTTPLEQKESYRWLEHYRVANECAEQLPKTMVVNIADREADMYDLYEVAQQNDSVKAHYLIRAQYNRRVCTAEGKSTSDTIKTALKREKTLGTIEISIPKTQKRNARTAKMAIYAKRLYIGLPDKRQKPNNYKPVEVTAILCSEINSSNQKDNIEWLLLTDLAAPTFASACEKIKWYCCRWEIEIYFKVLKSGCHIEKLQLTDENFAVALSFYMIIAWRLLYVTKLVGNCMMSIA